MSIFKETQLMQQPFNTHQIVIYIISKNEHTVKQPKQFNTNTMYEINNIISKKKEFQTPIISNLYF